MTATVKCIECKHAQWERTPSGRVKKKTAGDCRMPRPEFPTYLCYSPLRVFQMRIWPDYEGPCDNFAAL